MAGRLFRLRPLVRSLDDLELPELGAKPLDLVLQPAVLVLQPLDLGLRIGDGLELRGLHGLQLDDVVLGGWEAAAGPVPAVDLGPEPGAEAALALELDAVLLGKRNRERGPGDESAVHENRAEKLPGLFLLLERALKLLV